MVAGNSLTTTYAYDPDTGELLSIDYSDDTQDISFTYDRLGRYINVSDAVGIREFIYNDDLQLESETVTGLQTIQFSENTRQKALLAATPALVWGRSMMFLMDMTISGGLKRLAGRSKEFLKPPLTAIWRTLI